MEKVEEEDSTLCHKGMCVHYHCNMHELATVPVLLTSLSTLLAVPARTHRMTAMLLLSKSQQKL
jgi:hypothetical protein